MEKHTQKVTEGLRGEKSAKSMTFVSYKFIIHLSFI